MTLAYRLAHTSDLARAFSSRGGAARWNSEGVPMVYAAEHPALAALELLNGWNLYADLGGYFMYRCEIEDGATEDAVPELVAKGIDPRDTGSTRAFGDDWVAAGRSVALRVPSVVAPSSFNYLMNPAHPGFDGAVARENLGPFRYDPRLVDLVQRAKRAGYP